LLGSKNISDRSRIAEFITTCGYQWTSRARKRVDYLRVEAGDLGKLGELIMADFYNLDKQRYIGLLIENF